ncbi:MAG: DUF262 domain-containing HNH endonuclease family protein [Clostridia bacterium]|nr:DUF262 domain-containing HNH endonuclease family protein [Clostridia bacterium]
MKAEPEKLIDLMFDNKRQYQIPVYQRNYDWKKDNCISLFKDVLGAYDKEKTHFLGTIVQVQQDEENGIKHFIIIDGQQRMTSIYLLLKALYDLAEKDEDKSKLEGLLYNYSNGRVFSVEDKNKLKLKPIKTDNEQFLLLMSNKYDDMKKSTNIYQNYDLFKTLINSALNDGYSIKNIIKGLEYFQIVMISLNESAGDEPQVVFERINSTGEDLKLADLIRNYVLMTDKDQEELFEDYWSVMEEMIGKDDLSNYFITYLIFKLPNDIKKETCYQAFKEYVDKNHISHRDILIELKRYSKYYNVFKNSDTENYSKYINSLLKAFTDLKQTTIYPFLFAVFNDFENNIINEEILSTVLEFFIGYTVRRMVCGVPSNSLRGLYKTMYKRIFDTEDKKQDYLNSIYTFMATLSYTKDAVPTDTAFKENLLYRELYKNTNLCKYVLILLENGGNKETVNAGTATIEHIMPQNKTEDWRIEMGSDYDEIFETYLHTLGNLTLTGFNSELSDKKYTDKRNLIKQNSKFNVLNLEIVANETWSDKIILKRAQRLADRLIGLFSLPKVITESALIKPTNNRRMVNDGRSVIGTKITSFNFMGETKIVSNYTELLMSVMEFLDFLDSEKTIELAQKQYNAPNGTKPLISFDSSDMRSPKEIKTTGIYVETNKNADDIILFIKWMLSEYNISYEDLVFYIDEKQNDTTTTDNEIEYNNVDSFNGKKIGNLAYLLIRYLLVNDKISDSELIDLQDKTYSHSIFSELHYPVLATDRNAYSNGANVKRFYKDGVNVNGIMYYISSQWFENDRENLVDWYKRHI